jgi:hypothetical protein
VVVSKREEVTGEWRKVHNEVLRDLYTSPNIVRAIKSSIMGWAGHVAWMGRRENVYRVLVGESEGKRSLGRPRRRWEDNNKMDLREVGCGGMNWVELAQDRQVAGTCECGNEPSGSIKCGEFLD